jgi:hypothetical protein
MVPQTSFSKNRLLPVDGSSSALLSTPPSPLVTNLTRFSYCPLSLHPCRRAKLEDRRIRGSFLRLRLDTHTHTHTNVSLSKRRWVGRLDRGSNSMLGYITILTRLCPFIYYNSKLVHFGCHFNFMNTGIGLCVWIQRNL